MKICFRNTSLLPRIIIIISLFISFPSISQQKQNSGESKNDSVTTQFEEKKFNIQINRDSLENKQDSLQVPESNYVNELETVHLKSKSKFNALSLGIIQKEIKPLSQYERQLYTAGDFKPIHLLSLLGGSLQIDPILNAISGRTKRLKKYIKIERKENDLLFLQEHFKEYTENDLNIGKDLTGPFFIYLVDNADIPDLIDRKEYGELHFLIAEEWIKFKGFQNEVTAPGK